MILFKLQFLPLFKFLIIAVFKGSAANAFRAFTHGKSKTTVMFAQEIPYWLADGDDYICTGIPTTDTSDPFSLQ